MDDNVSITGNLFGRFEKELGLPANWLFTLVKESDWSFVIKLHALFEATLTHLVEASLQRPELTDFVARMNMGGRHGKLAMAQALGLVDKQQLKFLDLLARMRNECVHDVRNVNFSIADAYSTEVSNDDRQNMVHLVRRNTVGGAETGPLDEFLMKAEIKKAIWLTAINLVAILYNKTEFLAALARAAKQGRSSLNTVDDLVDWDSGTFFGQDLKK